MMVVSGLECRANRWARNRSREDRYTAVTAVWPQRVEGIEAIERGPALPVLEDELDPALRDAAPGLAAKQGIPGLDALP
jgi:hypothetical protein